MEEIKAYYEQQGFSKEPWRFSERYREIVWADVGFANLCLDCGSIVIDCNKHDDWHDYLTGKYAIRA